MRVKYRVTGMEADREIEIEDDEVLCCSNPENAMFFITEAAEEDFRMHIANSLELTEENTIKNEVKKIFKKYENQNV